MQREVEEHRSEETAQVGPDDISVRWDFVNAGLTPAGDCVHLSTETAKCRRYERDHNQRHNIKRCDSSL